VTAGSFSGPLTGTVTGHATLDLPLTGGTLSGNLGIGRAPGVTLDALGGTVRVSNGQPATVDFRLGPGVAAGDYASLAWNNTSGSQELKLYSDAGFISFYANAGERMRITAAGVIQDAAGNELGYKGLPTTLPGGAYTVLQSDNGKKIQQNAAGTITIPAGLSNDFVSSAINNTGAAIALAAGAGVTLYLAGTGTTGARTIATNGIASFAKLYGTDIYLVSGPGVT
jgi:hypothetical protein